LNKNIINLNGEIYLNKIKNNPNPNPQVLFEKYMINL